VRSTLIGRIGVTFATVSSLAVASACGSADDSGSNGSSGSNGGKITISAADVEGYLATPTDLPVTTPASKPVPTSLHVILVHLPLEQSLSLLKGLKEASAVLGWTVDGLTYDPANPATLGSTLESALSQKPDAILTTGALITQLESFIPKAQAAGIPVIPTFTPEEGQEGVYPVMNTAASGAYHSRILTETLLAQAAEAGDTPNVLEITVTELAAILSPIQKGVKQSLSEHCPDCEHHVLNISLADMFSGASSQQAVSYLQSHPDVKYVISDGRQIGTGLNEAIAAAGLTDIKTYGVQASDVQIKELAAGAEGAWTVDSFVVDGWILADQVARVVIGDPTDVWSETHTGYVATSENAGDIEDPADPVFPADFEDEFATLWGK
jgi:ribose transport system substrate-binding protein